MAATGGGRSLPKLKGLGDPEEDNAVETDPNAKPRKARRSTKTTSPKSQQEPNIGDSLNANANNSSNEIAARKNPKRKKKAEASVNNSQPSLKSVHSGSGHGDVSNCFVFFAQYCHKQHSLYQAYHILFTVAHQRTSKEHTVCLLLKCYFTY